MDSTRTQEDMLSTCSLHATKQQNWSLRPPKAVCHWRRFFLVALQFPTKSMHALTCDINSIARS